MITAYWVSSPTVTVNAATTSDSVARPSTAVITAPSSKEPATVVVFASRLVTEIAGFAATAAATASVAVAVTSLPSRSIAFATPKALTPTTTEPASVETM